MEDEFDLGHIESKAFEYAHLATIADNEKRLEAALIYYKEAIELLITASKIGSTIPQLKKKLASYISRAELISHTIESKKCESESIRSDEKGETLKTAQFLLQEALEEDEAGNYSDAILLYTEAIDFCIKLKNEVNDDNEPIKRQLGLMIEHALNRAERLKGIDKSADDKPVQDTLLSPDLHVDQVQKLLEKTSLTAKEEEEVRPIVNSLNEHKLMVIGQATYSKKELAVLRVTSIINGREYVPFLSCDLRERFAYTSSFQDKDGLLLLSAKQREHFHRWARISELSSAPKIIKKIDCNSIKQTLVTDCSFIAALTVSALYEKRFNKKIVTSIIYPQNRHGEPVYNPCGKYMIKLHINGIARKIVIDDRFPVDRYNSLLCSYSIESDEFWISLLEKAYMKVMGGYDFPGSNSSIDLNALTGWIPDKIDVKDSKFNADKVFRMLKEKKEYVLATVATGSLNETIAKRAGLVPNHAYALLDLREVEGKKLLLLKNPWRHLRWKGNYSECDTINWTESLKKALNYDPTAAKNFDNGVFWIDMKSFCNFYDFIYLSWSTSMFKYTFCTHSFWSANQGPTFDSKVIYDNPQFSLELSDKNTNVWALLSRHITDKDDFAENKVYLAIVVYKGGKKIYLADEPFINGVRVNSPHNLTKIPITDTNKFTLIVSQYEKVKNIYFSLRIYSPCPFKLTEIVDTYKYKEEIKTDQWNESNAGGCLNNLDTYSSNPVYRLEVLGAKDEENKFLIKLKGPKEYAVGMDIHAITIRNPKSPNFFHRRSCEMYRYGINVLQLENVPCGSYNLIPTTFDPGLKGPYFLIVEATSNFKLAKLK